ncbi:transporter substrate-binding domain-containing protein [Microbacterium imperiale]|uniref:ABC transporter substrate-binding protein n=1 Tax=Microbacterium imperiale TaxID=33884 RepID=A0A9W6HHU1_9MICO|nr:transporter substrate-binding domain-containing protein [Microbacterium imperiale]MBP2421105.1 ABC-type amino acid transport substrate-binding protein [Microbacterium imperiale]BFE41445.1 transporter substrate-binding domain-containing protein [Microbacterium imperiale]GLJ80396.1 ABC transporter substrate-binding protein [Microbacterium imperiale]
MRLSARMRVAVVTLLALSSLSLAGCGAQIPADPSGTLAAVEGGTLRAGVTPNGRVMDVSDDEPSGSEADAIRAFADSLDADVEWTVGSEEALVRELENGGLDLIAGGLTDQTPWTDKAGVTRPYAEITAQDGRTLKLVMLVPLGENAFLSRLETFLSERAKAGAL